MYIDSHAHILSQFYTQEEMKKLVERAKKAGMVTVINNGLDPQTNREVLKLAKTYPLLRPALGGYPIELLKEGFDLKKELEFIRQHQEEIIAIGEIGMDFKFSKEKEMQEKNFTAFLDLAQEIKKPVIIHSRKAEQEIIDILKKRKERRVVMHCFTGKKKQIKEIIDQGWYLSIPTSLVYAAQFQDMIELVDISRILTETDSPFMTPKKGVSFEEEKNEPANIPLSVAAIAKIKKMDETEVRNIVYMNFQKVFL